MTTTKQNLAKKATTTQAKPKEDKLVPAKQNTEVISLDFDSIRVEELKALSKEYKGLKVLDTTDSMKVAKSARKELRDRRYEIQNIVKDKKSILNGIKDRIVSIGDELIEIIRPAEEEVDSQIKAIEEKKQKEKEERERLERERKEKLQQDSINFYTGFRDRVRECTTVKELDKLAKEIESAEIPAFEEFTNNVSINIGNILSVEIPDKRVQIEEKAELERLRAEQKAKDEELARLRSQQATGGGEVFSEEQDKIVDTSCPASNTNDNSSSDDYDKNIKEKLLEAVDSIYLLYPDNEFPEGSPAYIIIKTCEGMIDDVKKKTTAMINESFPND